MAKVQSRKSNDSQIPPPSLWHHDLDAVAVVMTDTLRGTLVGWETARALDIVAEDCSSLAGVKEYKPRNNANQAVPSVAQHVLDEYFSTNRARVSLC